MEELNVEELNFLETDRTFRSYYRTLRDVNYFLKNDSDIDSNELQTANRVLTKLIFDFIGLDGTTLRDMDPQRFAREFQIFIPDLLAIIQNSGTNDVDFEVLSDLLDEMLGIVNLRARALERIPKAPEEETTETNDSDNWDGMVEINVENVDMDETTPDDDSEEMDQNERLQSDEDEDNAENADDAENVDEDNTENEDEIEQFDDELVEELNNYEDEDEKEQFDDELVEELNNYEDEDEETPIVSERLTNETYIDLDESDNIINNQVDEDESRDYHRPRRYRYE